MAINRRTWAPTSPKQKKSQVPESIKRSLSKKADELIKEVLNPKHIKPPPTDNDFNYLVEMYSRWRQNYFYFCAKYNCPGPNSISPSFETKFARMEYVGNERFNLSYMRHTEQWFEIYQRISMEECLRIIAEEPDFIP